MEKKFAENEYVILYTENQILFIEYKEGTCINLTVAGKIIDLISAVCKEERYLVLQDMNNLKWIDKASRNFLATHPVTNQMLAWAYHAKDPLHQLMFNIYVTFSKPEVKSEFFKNSQEGVKWLLKVEQPDERV